MSLNVQIQERLGKPAFNSHGVSLFQVDAVEAMACLPREVFDLTVTSPPYNIGKEYETPMPLPDYIRWSETWINQVYQLCASRQVLFGSI
jgi:adenine-specific DNA-methyltransferase